MVQPSAISHACASVPPRAGWTPGQSSEGTPRDASMRFAATASAGPRMVQGRRRRAAATASQTCFTDEADSVGEARQDIARLISLATAAKGATRSTVFATTSVIALRPT